MQSHVCVYEGGRVRFFTRREGDVKTEAETGVMGPPAKACWQPPRLEETGNGSPQSLSREYNPADTLILAP